LYLHLFALYTCHFSVVHSEKFLNFFQFHFCYWMDSDLVFIYGCCVSIGSPTVLRSCDIMIHRFIQLFSMLFASLISHLIILLEFYMAVNGSAFWILYYLYVFYLHQIITAVLQSIYELILLLFCIPNFLFLL